MTDLFGQEVAEKKKTVDVFIVTRSFALTSRDKIINAGETIKIFDELTDDFGGTKYYAHYNNITISIPAIFKKNYLTFLRKETVNG